jgi:parallel beta-helix repeat protein
MHQIGPIRWLAVLTIGLFVPAGAYARPALRATSKHVPNGHRKHAPKRVHRTVLRHRASTLVKSATAAQAPITIPAPTGTIYYVSSSGSDASPGTSPVTAWQTVEQVDRAHLVPGDEVLFEGGATFADDALMPGWGESTSGTSAAPISFGSYGAGQATITQGVWFKADDHLAFQDLRLGNSDGYSGTGFQGDGEDITILDTAIEHVGLGINAEGDDWTIAGNTINHTGDSGMLLGYTAAAPGDPAGGSDYLVSGNTVTNTGLNPADTYGTHGIYVKVTDSTITGNTISHFNDDGISVRYRDSTISHNNISFGKIGVAWFQYDTTAGISRWTDNTISNVTSAGIFVCGLAQDCREPLESFQISGGAISDAGTVRLNLQPTTGTYSVGQITSTPAAGALRGSVRAPKRAKRASGRRHRRSGRSVTRAHSRKRVAAVQRSR